MKLFGSVTSPYVRHVRVALAQSGFDYTFVEADYAMSAERSPTAKVPFFEDGDLTLTDSTSILKHVREKSGMGFLEDLEDCELYFMADTLTDAGINQFMMEKEGATADRFPYLGRQQFRVLKGLEELNRRLDPGDGIGRDGALRTACLIGWGLFRNRFSLDGLDNLRGLMEAAGRDPVFVETAPRD